jgi:hypothetical protein
MAIELYIITARAIYIAAASGAEGLLGLDMHVFELEYPFCSNPRCELHLRIGDPRVHGYGNWAQMPDGRMIGRGLYDNVFLCDPCGRAQAAAAIASKHQDAAA